MINKFKIFEDYKRKWGESNKFSELHRDLSRANYMLDIDGLYWDLKSESIVVVFEDKFKFDGLLHSNLLERGNFQRTKLYQFSKRLGSTLVFCEESTDTYYYVKDDKVIKNKFIKKSLNKYYHINSENSLYVEMPYGVLKSVMYINNGSIPEYIIDFISKYFPVHKVDIIDDIIIIDDKYNISNLEEMRESYNELGLLAKD